MRAQAKAQVAIRVTVDEHLVRLIEDLLVAVGRAIRQQHPIAPIQGLPTQSARCLDGPRQRRDGRVVTVELLQRKGYEGRVCDEPRSQVAIPVEVHERIGKKAGYRIGTARHDQEQIHHGYIVGHWHTFDLGLYCPADQIVLGLGASSFDQTAQLFFQAIEFLRDLTKLRSCSIDDDRLTKRIRESLPVVDRKSDERAHVHAGDRVDDVQNKVAVSALDRLL